MTGTKWDPAIRNMRQCISISGIKSLPDPVKEREFGLSAQREILGHEARRSGLAQIFFLAKWYLADVVVGQDF